MPQKKYILNKEQVEKKIQRLAFEIAERNLEEKDVYLIAIKENGVTLAKKIAQTVADISAIQIQMLELSLDKKYPTDIKLSGLPAEKEAVMILIDDVASSGKTMLYALKPFLEVHPKKIETLVLVERTHKAFPVQINYVGLSVATTLQEHIFVEVVDDEIFGAYME